MAELLVYTHTLSDADPTIDCLLPKRGYVIYTSPDGYAWAAGEMVDACFRIITVSGMSDAQALALTTPEPGDPTTNPKLLKWYYRLNIDNSSLSSAFATWLADDSRATPKMALDLSTVTNITVQNPSEQ